MVSVLTDTLTERRPHVDEDRGEGDARTRQGTSEVASIPPEVRTRRTEQIQKEPTLRRTL